MTDRRALVIGAGHHGLLCAGTLAEDGWDVTVLEQASHPGGAGAARAVRADASGARPWRRLRGGG